MTTFDIRSHLEARGVIYGYPSLYVDEEENVASFVMYTLTGKLVGFHQYRPLGPKKKEKDLKPKQLKYFTHAINGEHAFWGAETINPYDPLVLVVEGVFDAIALHVAGFNALAMVGNNPTALRNLVYTNTQHEFVPVCDGDQAGLMLAKYRSSNRMVVMPDGTDPGDFVNRPQVLRDYITLHMV